MHPVWKRTSKKMGQPTRCPKATTKRPSATENEMRKHKRPKRNIFLSVLPAELQLDIVCHLPLTSVATICQLNKYWRAVGTDELLRRLLPFTPPKTRPNGKNVGKDLLRRAIRHFIDINDVDALQRLLDFRPKHEYFRRKTTSLLQDEPASLRIHVTKDQEERFFLAGDLGFTFDAVRDAMKAALRHRDMSCLQLLVDRGLADYSWLLAKAVDYGFGSCVRYYDRFAPPHPGLDPRSGRNPVFEWLVSYPPRHVTQAMLLMWGRPYLQPSREPLGGWRSPIGIKSDDNMLVAAAGRGYPSCQDTISELGTMLGILTDDNSASLIPEAREPLSNALHVAREMAAMWPGTLPLVVDYLQSVYTWGDDPSSSS